MSDKLTQIQIRGFRTQKKFNLDLDPKVTTIIGESAEGKSTILRALMYAALNKPAGDGMINWDSEKVIVRVIAENKGLDRKVVRIRSKSINKYKLDKKAFVAFGNDVPDEIAQLLNLSDVNFQGQFARHFWFCETAGEVSRQLNKIIDLSVIDRTMSNIGSELRDTKSKVKLIDERLEDAQTDKKKYKNVKKIDADLKRCEKLQKQISSITQKRSLLHDLMEEGTIRRSEQINASDQVTGLAIIVSLASQHRKILGRGDQLAKLTSDLTDAQLIKGQTIPSMEHLDNLKYEHSLLEDRIWNLENFIEEANSQEEDVKECGQTLSKFKKQFNKATEGNCPICLKPMS